VDWLIDEVLHEVVDGVVDEVVDEVVHEVVDGVVDEVGRLEPLNSISVPNQSK